MLTGQQLEPAMRVSVQVYRLLAYLVPCPEGIVTEYDEMPLDRKFGVILDAFPAGRLGNILGVVVADDEMLPATQTRQEPLAITTTGRHEVSEMPDFVLRPNDRVPVADE